MSIKRNRRASLGIDTSRRSLMLGAAAAGSLSALAVFKKAHGLSTPIMSAGFTNDKEDVDTVHYAQLHEGKGVIDVKFFFRQGKFAKPALLLTYAIPPGASEGVHTHRPGDTKMGSFDEFYYIISGNGEMQIAGNKIPVAAGDHVFTPNEVAHGIENTSESDVLKVYLVAVIRE
jgi:oxalate decarboxylase/phosphoglucose isomerase-like protein (cupin superfamily)